MRTIRASALILFLLISLILPVKAQVAGGAITGTVTNESGAAIPDVHVSVKDVTSGLDRTAASNTTGVYGVPALPAGNYEMSVSVSGFVTQVWTEISVTAGVARVINLTMRAGDSAQIVRLTAPPALVSEPCPATCGSANSSTVRDTPLNGRDWAALATLQAGVTGVQNGSASGGGNTDRGFGAAVSISGSRPDQNSYRLDGISINDYANGAPGSVLGDNLGIDAVEQVSVLGSNYPAEYGRTSGGVINVVTRSGKNTFHGSMYEFLRNSALDARNFFDDQKVPPFKRNQFGGSAGAPIIKDRTFIFGDYEGLRQSLGVTSVNTVPSVAARSGQISTGTVVVDPAVARFIAAFYPLPNGQVTDDTGIYSFAAQQVTTENYFTARVDHKFSDSDSVFGSYMRDSSKTVEPGTFGELFSDIVSSRQVISVHEQHIFNPNLLNLAQIGFSRAVGIQGKVSSVLNPFMSDPSYAFIPGGFAGDIRSIPGVTDFTGAPTAQGNLSSSRSLYWNSFQGGNDVVLTHGRHTLKFGAEIERMQDNQVSAGNINGSFRFDSMSLFLTNQPASFQGTATPVPTRNGLRETLFGAYVQDDIRLHKTLTLNAGLRYEMVTVPTEAHGQTAALRNINDALALCGVARSGCSGTGALFSNPTLRNIEPRMGFAWNPLSGKTLLRGGFGIFDVLPLPYEFTLTFQRTVPFVQTVVGETAPGEFPVKAYQRLSVDSTTGSAYFPDSNPKRNYVMQWNLSVARELSPTLAVTIGYVGSRGIHQPYRVDNIDMVLPTLTSAGYQWPVPNTAPPVVSTMKCSDGSTPTSTGCPWPTLNPNFGRINSTLWQAHSFYDAMQADIAKRVSHGFTFHGAYTFGKSIDTLSATEADDAFPNGLFNQLFFAPGTTRGLSDFNVAQTFVLSFTWEIPGPAKDSRLPQWALGGWQVGGLYKATTGQPFTLVLGGDPAGMRLDETGQVPNYIQGCALVSPNFKKNVLGPIYIDPTCFTPPTVASAAATTLAYPCTDFTGAVPPPGGQVYCANLRGNLGRNIVIGPGLSKLDFSVFKNNYVRRISESFNAQFRAEFFNILNRANFSSPTDNLAVFDQNGVPIRNAGRLTSTQTTSRQIQFALKLIW